MLYVIQKFLLIDIKSVLYVNLLKSKSKEKLKGR